MRECRHGTVFRTITTTKNKVEEEPLTLILRVSGNLRNYMQNIRQFPVNWYLFLYMILDLSLDKIYFHRVHLF